MSAIHEAAERRAAGVRAPADRPSQRRADEHGGANITRAMSATMEMRDSDVVELLTFTGHATVYERGYEMYDMFGPYTEIVSRGAASETLARGDLSVPLVLDHDPMRRIAITDNGTLELSEDETGLYVFANQLDPNDHDVAYITPKMRSGLIKEMSFKFRITNGVWNDDYTEYRINAFDLHRGDVAIVGYGASPWTDGNLRANVSQPQRLRGIDIVHEYDVAHRR